MSSPVTRNIIDDLPRAQRDEIVEVLLKTSHVRLERIVSHGQASPEGFWYDQTEGEWVVVLAGSAGLMIEGEPSERKLLPGDAVYLAPHCRHRVNWTDPDTATVWLALFVADA